MLWLNRPFSGCGRMVQNKLCWDASYTVGLSKQRKVRLNWYEFLCFGSSTGNWCNLRLDESLFILREYFNNTSSSVNDKRNDEDMTCTCIHYNENVKGTSNRLVARSLSLGISGAML